MRPILLIGHTVASLIVGVSAISMVYAEDKAGHAKHHNDFYSTLKVPGKGYSCCNDKDCRPVQYRHTSAGLEMLIEGRWIRPPQDRIMVRDTPDNGGHWCGQERGMLGGGQPHTICAVIPTPSI